MMLKHINILIWTIVCFCLTTFSYAQPDGEDGLGQIIQINTHFTSFVGKPIWLLEIRDVDNDQTIPYLFDIRRGDNYWTAITYARNYLIKASNLQIETYQSRYNKYKNYRISNFCHLESSGRVLRGESMYITIEGDLTPNSDTYFCNVTIVPNPVLTFIEH